MPRATRSHAPDSAIHITARTVGGARWFTEPLRDNIWDILCEGALNGRAYILACVVMTNHFHMVVRQGPFPLGWMMQRILQRLAHLMRKVHSHQGHVFGGRYWSSVCDSPAYLRQAIVYTHLNPWKAKLCDDSLTYRWSSHHHVMTSREDSINRPIAVHETLMNFAHDAIDLPSMKRNYLTTLQYWMNRHVQIAEDDRFLFESAELAPHPPSVLGDAHWLRNYLHALPPVRARISQRDVCDRSIELLTRIQPRYSLDEIRVGIPTRVMRRVRRQLIAGLLTSGCKRSEIARCLRVSPSVVSDVATALLREIDTPVADS